MKFGRCACCAVVTVHFALALHILIESEKFLAGLSDIIISWMSLVRFLFRRFLSAIGDAYGDRENHQQSSQTPYHPLSTSLRSLAASDKKRKKDQFGAMQDFLFPNGHPFPQQIQRRKKARQGPLIFIFLLLCPLLSFFASAQIGAYP